MPKKTNPKQATKTSTGANFDPKAYEKEGVTSEDVMQIKKTFELFDSDGSGEIDTNEFKDALQKMEIDPKNPVLQEMLADVDRNQSGTIDFNEYVDMMTGNIQACDADTKENLAKVFAYLKPSEEDEKLDFNGLKQICKDLGLAEEISDDELNEMIVRADTDRDGRVSFDEFFTIMTKNI